MNNLFNIITTLKTNTFNLYEFITMEPKKDKTIHTRLYREKVFQNTKITHTQYIGNYTDQYGTWPLFLGYHNNTLVFAHSQCI